MAPCITAISSQEVTDDRKDRSNKVQYYSGAVLYGGMKGNGESDG